MDVTLRDTNTPNLSEPESIYNEGVLYPNFSMKPHY